MTFTCTLHVDTLVEEETEEKEGAAAAAEEEEASGGAGVAVRSVPLYG